MPSNIYRLGPYVPSPHVSRAICPCRKSLVPLRWHGAPAVARPAPPVGDGEQSAAGQGQESGEKRPGDLDGVRPHNDRDRGSPWRAYLLANDVRRLDGRAGLAFRQVRATRYSWCRLRDAADSTDAHGLWARVMGETAVGSGSDKDNDQR